MFLCSQWRPDSNLKVNIFKKFTKKERVYFNNRYATQRPTNIGLPGMVYINELALIYYFHLQLYESQVSAV